MITKFVNKLNKRTHKYKTYELNYIHKDILAKTLSSPLLGDGSVNIKIVVANHQVKQYLTLPIQLHYSLMKCEYVPIEKSLNVHQVELNNNNFFTLNLLTQSHIENLVKEARDFTGEGEYLVFNLVLKKKNKLNNLFTNQYYQFVNGVENPSSNKLVNLLQDKFIEENKIFVPVDIMDIIEHKINDLHYEFQLFFGLHYESQSKEDLVLDVINDIFDDFSHMNHLNVEEISTDKYDAINNHEFLYQYQKQFISLSEIHTLLFNDEVVEQVKTNNDIEESVATIDTPITNEIETLEHQTHESTISLEDEIEPQQPILQPASAIALDTLPSLELLPVQIETNEDDVDKDIPKRIENALRRVKIVTNPTQKINIVDFKIGASLIKTTIEIPPDKNISDITKKFKDIKAALGADSLAIDQGEKPDTVSFFMPRTEKQPIYLRTLLENDDFIEFAEKHPLPFVTGVDPLGNPIYTCLNKLTHLLVVGQTDSGKSVWLNQLILTLLMLRKPDEMMMYLIDPKMVELTQFKDFPQVQEVVTDMQKANKLMEKLIVEMEKRYEKLSEGKVKNLWDYNKKYPNNKIPFIVCVIDEYADLKTVNPTVDEYLARLGQKARASGIHLVVATQRSSVDVIEGTTKTNLPSKISFKLDSSASYKTIFESIPPVKPTGKGHGIMSFLGQSKEFEQFQGAIISIDSAQEEETFEKIKKSFKGEKVEGIKVEKSETESGEPEDKEEPIIKMKKIIAETGEHTIRGLQKQMKMNQNKISDLMRQLVDEGWLLPPESTANGKWDINEECEELSKLRQVYGGDKN